jgi:hypothetical protein
VVFVAVRVGIAQRTGYKPAEDRWDLRQGVKVVPRHVPLLSWSKIPHRRPSHAHRMTGSLILTLYMIPSRDAGPESCLFCFGKIFCPFLQNRAQLCSFRSVARTNLTTPAEGESHNEEVLMVWSWQWFAGMISTAMASPLAGMLTQMLFVATTLADRSDLRTISRQF